MKKQDFRSLSREVRADRRKTAFEMMDEGYTYANISKRVGIHYTTLSDWRKKRGSFEKNDYRGEKRGRGKDEQKYLSKEQEEETLKAIKNSTPDKYDINYFLWSRKAIREFLIKKYKITLAFQTISKYTKRWGLSSQRPKKQASEQDAKKVEKWVKEEYPKILRKAKKQGAEIHWGDETNLNINTNYQKTYALKGKTPTAKIPARKTSYSLISSFTNQGKLRYMAYKGGMNIPLFIIFLKRLAKDTDKKVFLIVDNLRVHHGKKVQEWQKQNSEKIEIFFPASILSARQSR